jgi:hypothetical protein
MNVPDIMGVCGVDGGLVVLELVSVSGLAARDSRLVGFPVMGLWAARRISCRRVLIGVVLSVHSQFAIYIPPHSVMFHIILRSETLLTNQHSLRYAICRRLFHQ